MKKLQNGTIRNCVGLEDFAKVFKVFESFPFFESWSDDEVREEYESFQHGGIIFGYYADDGECAGILTMKPYEPGKHPVKYPSDAKVMYLSDVATRFEYRNQGIGTHLFEHAIRHLEDMITFILEPTRKTRCPMALQRDVVLYSSLTSLKKWREEELMEQSQRTQESSWRRSCPNNLFKSFTLSNRYWMTT